MTDVWECEVRTPEGRILGQFLEVHRMHVHFTSELDTLGHEAWFVHSTDASQGVCPPCFKHGHINICTSFSCQTVSDFSVKVIRGQSNILTGVNGFLVTRYTKHCHAWKSCTIWEPGYRVCFKASCLTNSTAFLSHLIQEPTNLDVTAYFNR